MGQGNIPDIDTKIDNEYIGGIYDGKPFYSKQIIKKDFIVFTKAELLKALEDAKFGETVYVKDDAVIDLTGERDIVIKAGVILASGRGLEGSVGGLLKTSLPGTNPLFKCGSNVTITGLRFDGGDPEVYHNSIKLEGPNAIRDNIYKVPVTVGIRTNYPGLTIENCEFYGWTHAAISIQTGAHKAYIHHNYIHHNRRTGLGYGIVLNAGDALIKANIFDFNRHDISGWGEEGTSFIASYNVFLQNTTAHAVDMHGGHDRKDGTNVAGSKIHVFNNKFKLSFERRAVVIRGIPTDQALIENNIVNYVSNSPIKGEVSSNIKRDNHKPKIKYTHPFRQLYSEGNMIIRNNIVNK